MLGDSEESIFISLKTLRKKVLQETHWPYEISMDYTKCMILTKEHGIAMPLVFGLDLKYLNF